MKTSVFHLVLGLFLITLLGGAMYAMPGSIAGNDGPKEPAAYYLVGGDAASLSPETADVVQEGKAFAPDLVSVPVGSTVSFPNRDDLMHNVYSPKGAAGFFDMGSAERTLADNSNLLSRKMAEAGVIEIACAIHPVMQGLVFVVPSRYHTVSKDGTYQFNSVPGGTYDVMVMTKKGTATKLKSITVN